MGGPEKGERLLVARQEDGGAEQLEERVVAINRVSKTVAGGRRFHFSALVVVGDRQGKVGVALGKATEVPEAIRKAIQRAKKSMVEVPMREGTIPHQVEGHFGPGLVILKPAPPGTGVIAGGSVRAVVELAGIRDIVAKVLGSRNPVNVVYAAMEGLRQLKRPEEVLTVRGKVEAGFTG